MKIAADCEEKGLFEDAISLYDLGKRPNLFSLFRPIDSYGLSLVWSFFSDRLDALKGRNYNKVVSLLSTTLSQVLSEADKHQSDRNRMKSRGTDF